MGRRLAQVAACDIIAGKFKGACTAAAAHGVEAEALPHHLSNADKLTVKAYRMGMYGRRWMELYKKSNSKVLMHVVTATVSQKYHGLPEIPQICASSVHNWMSKPDKVWKPPGRQSYLPNHFYEQLVRWIKARHTLKFPVFKIGVFATANAMATTSGAGACQAQGGLPYKRLVLAAARYSHTLGSAQIKTLKIDCEHWGTADNLRQRSKMLANALVAA
eukprot:6201739-Pleurochrysis_carterae.AAC.5